MRQGDGLELPIDFNLSQYFLCLLKGTSKTSPEGESAVALAGWKHVY